MSWERIADGVVDWFLWLYCRHWEQWELLALGLAAVCLIVMAVRRHRRDAVDSRHLQERTASSHFLKM